MTEVDRLDLLRNRFNEGASVPGLFHITRTSLDSPYAADESDRLDEHWQEFLGDGRPFDFSSYRLSTGRIQQCCFYGDERKLRDFTGLAALALASMPVNLLPLHHPDRDVRRDRDHFLLSLYRLASRDEYLLPLDFKGVGRYSRAEPDAEVLTILGGLISDSEREKAAVEACKARLQERSKDETPFIYASLALDVFTSAAVAVEYIKTHANELFGPQDTSIVPTEELERLFDRTLETNREDHGQLQHLSDHEERIMTVIEEAGRPLTTREVLTALSSRNLPAAESTTKSVLSSLVRQGLLANRQDRSPRGYRLPEWDDR